MNRIFKEDPALIQSLRQWLGFCLTGEIGLFQGFLYCFGSGANGKSSFFEALKLLLGDYFGNTDVSVLLQKAQGNETDKYALAELQGKRLLVCDEIPADRKLNEGLIKNLTGGEMVNARRPYGMPFSYEMQAKLAIFGNHKLVIKGTDYGIWRRVKMIPFETTIPENERLSKEEISAKFSAELSGIFNWAIEGLKDLRTQGRWTEAEKIKQETQIYREESDDLSGFLNETLVVTNRDRDSVHLSEIFALYDKFCENYGEERKYSRPQDLAKELVRRQFKKYKKSGELAVIQGVKLKNSQNELL